MSWNKVRWLFLGLLAIAGMNLALTEFFLYDYVQSWGGAFFKLMSGVALGWLVFRFVIGVDISSLPPEQRPMAGLSLAIIIGFFGHALANGS